MTDPKKPHEERARPKRALMRCEWCGEYASARFKHSTRYVRYACASASHRLKTQRLTRLDLGKEAYIETSICPTGFSMFGRMVGPDYLERGDDHAE